MSSLLFTTIILLVLLIIYKFIAAGILYKQYRKETQELVLGMTLFLLFMAIDRILWFYVNFYFTDFLFQNYQEFAVLIRVTNMTESLAFLVLIIISEKVILKERTHYFITIIYVGLTVLAFIFIGNYNLSQLIFGVANGIAVIFIPLSYFYLALISQGSVRKKAVSIFLGLTFYLVAQLFCGYTIYSLFLNSTLNALEIRLGLLIFSSIMKYIAISLILIGFLRKFE